VTHPLVGGEGEGEGEEGGEGFPPSPPFPLDPFPLDPFPLVPFPLDPFPLEGLLWGGSPGAGVGVPAGVEEEELGVGVGVLGVSSRFPKIPFWAPSVKPHSLKTKVRKVFIVVGYSGLTRDSRGDRIGR